ncbi:hypothetical protein F0L74_25230 [Chitinophaga agrisoli]|uniref:Cytochrome c-552/4 domain-containing protein n=1 Tax=Chitinophaga agrisoli TaxID=2607653 RepID=A0A5B2VLX8_9BACT|nr:multiheme c-type cytochrome [Chitinophaga agrisoli]KAA2239506.1 hypothetical protein F0L74_25230 [Chitinophaga agrisoli]
MNKRLWSVSFCLISGIILLSQCIRKANQQQDLRGPQFAGSAACVSCHKSIYESYVATAHYHTSRPASQATVKGGFNAPGNIFQYSNGMQVHMEARDSGLFQAAYMNNAIQEAHRFDIAVGSGRKAQTYLYWTAGKYFQLPLSYFVTTHSWANSPGFPPSYPKFDRMIPGTCFGCHSSMVGIKSTQMVGRHMQEEFEKNQLIYGIDCERCHGPALEHAVFHTDHPQEKEAHYITNIRSLKNQQKLDMCAVCHSGLQTPQKSIFGFRPGDAYSDYFYPDIMGPGKPEELDVHGTQYQLFTGSKCFKQSVNMNCSTCHNPHTSERNVQTLSQRCISCHQPDSHPCKLTSLPAEVLAQNCVDCHMPNLPSGNITLLTNGQQRPTADSMHTHLITIYPEATEKIMQQLAVSH